MRVSDIEAYWTDPPPVFSPALLQWMHRYSYGWLPNKRVRRMGYYDSADFYGVYIWEYLHSILPISGQTSPC